MSAHLIITGVAQGTDVYLFLIGMMLLSELALEHGVFDWLSAHAVRAARGSGTRLFALVYALGIAVTIFMSNDATAVVLTPAVLAAVRKAKAGPLPHLFACAMIANAASFVLPISNPANLVVFRGGMPPLARWLGWFLLPSLASIAVTFLALRFLFRAELARPIDRGVEAAELKLSGKLVLGGLGLLVAVLLVAVLLGASTFDRELGLPSCVTALFVTAIVSLQARANPLQLARRISWASLLLVAGLFVLAFAAERFGLLEVTKAWLAHVQALPATLGLAATGFAVGVANNLINNLPLGLVAGATLHAMNPSPLMSQAVLIGVDLGPNLSVTGSLATILWLLALRRGEVKVSAWEFLKIGAVAMPLALVAALGAAALATSWVG